MDKAPIIFSGDIPKNYEHYLTPFLFDPFADDLLERLELTDVQYVLELACGTGCVTKRLVQHLESSAKLAATDLEAAMLAVAKNIVDAPNVEWNTVDMTNISYDNDLFDLIVCQFGVMLVPDKLKALTEMHRVLRKGGKVVFSVWNDLASNDMWNIGNKVLNSYLDIHPILQDPGPFSMNEQATLKILKEAGFTSAKATIVKKTGTIESAAIAAKGFTQGLPVVIAISKKDPMLIPQIEKAMEQELVKQLGDHPMRSGLKALVFEAIK